MSKLARTGSCGSSSPPSPRLPSRPSRTPAVAVSAIVASAARHTFNAGGASLHSHSSLASASIDLDDLALLPARPSAMSGSGTEVAMGSNVSGSSLSVAALLQRAAEFMQLALKVVALLVTLLAEAWTSRCPREGMRRLARPARAHQHFIAAR